MKKGIIGNIIAGIITIVVAYILNYLFLPAWNIRSVGIYLYLIIVAIIATVSFSINYACDTKNRTNSIITAGSGIITIALFLALIIGGIMSTKIFNAKKYQQIADVEIGNFKEEFIDLSQDKSKLAVVDLDTAIRVGNRTIGNLNHSSWFEVDLEYNLIMYKDKQYRISPLNYGNFFKYTKAKKAGIPGYVLVDAQTQEAKFIEIEGGIKYSPSAYFANNLKRHLRKQYRTYIFGNSYFEIDEQGKSYWITAVQTPTIGLGGAVEKSFIITNASTGESKEYKLEELPEWVDHAFGLNYLMDIAYWHYEYIDGYINFSKTGVYRTSYYHIYDEEESGENFAGYNSFINKNGDVCFYTGLTPANNSESNIGFLLVNTKTGKFTQYECAGAEESSAQGAAEGLVQNLGYKATFPTVVNVGGEETYFMCLKDKAGLIQRYALCNIKNYAIVVEADSIESVINAYSKKFGNNEVNEEKANEVKEITGKISEKYSANIEGTTYFYYIIDENLYKSSITINEKQVILKNGSDVKIKYNDGENGIRNIVSIEII